MAEKNVPPKVLAARVGPTLLVIPFMVYAFIVPDPELDEPATHARSCPPWFNQASGNAKAKSKKKKPNTGNLPIALVESQSRVYQSEDSTSYGSFYRLSTYDPESGDVVGRVRIDGGGETGPGCEGYFGGELLIKTESEGYHLRDPETLEIVTPEGDLFKKVEGQIKSVYLDTPYDRLIVTLTDARQFIVSADLSVAPKGEDDKPDQNVDVNSIYGGVVLSRIGGARGVTSAGSVTESRSGNRSKLLLDGDLLGDTDWLSPQLLLHAPSGSAEWPDPPSIIVCELPAVGEKRTRLTRMTLEGELLWQYEPMAKPGGSKTDCPWQSTSGGDHISMIPDPAAIIAIDAKTGKETVRRGL